MILAIITLLVIFSLILLSLVLKGLKKLITFLISITVLVTIGLCVTKPEIHKPFSISIINYIIKFNNDGSMTTTKQVSTTKIKDRVE